MVILIKNVKYLYSTIHIFFRPNLADMVGKIVGLAVGLFVLAALIPSAITNITGANTTGWGATNITLWGILPVMVIVGLVLLVLYTAKGRS